MSNQNTNEALLLEYLTFRLGEETYGLDIMAVKEIRGYEKGTKLANVPEFVLGVVNLRGDIVPIVDLRIRFNVGKPIYDEFTIVIMLNINERFVGIVVDEVCDVIKVDSETIKPAPQFGAVFDMEYLEGLVTVEDIMVILVNIQALVTSDTFALIDKNNEEQERPQ
ncbi:chemotaxis protein CheW [Alteromonas sediminis]|nr:chemotaxis protein CheW [Alteromonas sediminis]